MIVMWILRQSSDALVVRKFYGRQYIYLNIHSYGHRLSTTGLVARKVKKQRDSQPVAREHISNLKHARYVTASKVLVSPSVDHAVHR